MTAALAGEAFKMVDVISCFHNHLEGGDEFRASRAVTRRAEQSVHHTHIHTTLLFSTIVNDLRPLHTARHRLKSTLHIAARVVKMQAGIL